MTIELHSSLPSDETLVQVASLVEAARRLSRLTAPQARALYEELESARDVLSLILDRADGKTD